MRGSMSDFREVPAEYAHCRVWGHTWDFTTLDDVSTEFLQGMKCIFCGTHRVVRITKVTGLRERGNKYTYPEDMDKEAVPYKMPKGSGGALTSEERGSITLGEIQARYDELSARRKRRKKA